MQSRIRNRSAVHRALELLEDRTVPSVLIPESEPNDVPSAANVLPRVLGAALDIKASIGAPGDRDWYRIDLERGDVFGAALKAQGDMDPMLHLFDSTGQLVIGNDDAFYYGANWLPPESPLPWNHSSIRDPELYCVISAPGTYYLQASTFDDETAGNYKLDVVIARPGLESQPVGTKQILFFDFDGAIAKAEGVFRDTYTLAPLADSLSGWGLTAADENALIDQILARTTDKISTFIRANGSNGDFAATGIPGQFDLEIRNSRDDADTFGVDPLVSRMTIGATDNPRLANEMIGLNEYIDVGNFKTDDQSAVSVNFATWLLATYPVQAPATRIDMIAEYVAIIAAHEFAHAVGCWHTDYSTTDPFEGVPTFMDRSFESPLGPDLIFGTADDRTLQLLPDSYHRDEAITGIQDTLTAYSYGLSTGTRSAQALGAAAIAGVTDGQLSGSPKTLSTFSVALTVPGSSLGYDEVPSMSFRTLNGTAKSGEDYIEKTGTLTFAPGEPAKTITIEVKGDSKKESSETFYLDLYGLSSNGLFTKNRGVGTILNDD